MKKKNIAWLLSAAMILTTAAAPVETVSVNAAEEFQAETNEAEDTVTDTATDTVEEVSEVPENEDVADAESNAGETITTGETASEDSQDNDTGDLELFEDSAEELEVNTETDNSDTVELEADVKDGFSDGEAVVAGVGESPEVVDSGSCGSDATYKLYGDGRLVIEGSGEVQRYFSLNEKIKSVVIGEGITSLEGAFYSCVNLTSVILPKTLTNLGNDTFVWCRSLSTIVLPESLTSIGDDVFFDCSSLTSINIPEKITAIGKEMFRGCSGLTSIQLSENITEIGEGAFNGCSSLTDIQLSENITKIGASAFNGCSSLTNIQLSENITEIGASAFNGCSSLTNIQLSENIIEIGESVFCGCSSLTDIRLPDSITRIGSYAFSGCAIKKVTMPDTITEVGVGVFSNCGNLRSIKLSKNLNYISNGLVSNCSRLDSIVLPDKITEIGNGAFSNCNLTEIKLPPNLISIGDNAFSGNNLSSISFPESLKTIGNDAFFSNNLSNISFSEGLKIIGNGAFYNCKFSSIELPDTVTDIGESAFYWNSNLQSINIPKNVAEIKKSTFYGCSSLQNITLPDGLTKIGKNAFTGTMLGEVTLPDSVTTIEEYAFEGSRLDRIKLSKNLTEIPYGAFSNCTNLVEIILPDNLTHVDTNAFSDCTNLRSIYIANASAVIEKKAFGYNLDGTKTYSLVMGHKDSTAETYATENDFPFHNIEDPLIHHEEVKPTCTSDGNREYWHCDGCNWDFSNAEGSGVVWGDLTISKFGHNLTYHEGKIAICTQSGNQTYYHCENCGKNFTDWDGATELTESDIIIPAPGHRIIYREARDANCISDGNKASYYCTGCGTYFVDKDGKQVAKDVVIPMNGKHSMIYYPARDANCANSGNRAYYHCSICSSDFLDKDGKQPADMSDMVIPVNGKHNLVYQKANNATCINAGNKEYYFCNNCFKYFQDKDGKQQISGESVTIPANGVHALEYHSKEEPNCIHGGKKAYYYCTGCYQYFLDQEGKQKVAEADLILPTEPQNHTMRYIEGYEATCTNEGRKGYYICDYCQQIFLDEKGTQRITEGRDLVIPKTESHVLELEKGYPAECLNPGMKDTYRCTSCGKHFLDKDGKEEIQQDSDVLIPELGHKFTDEQWVNHGSGKHTVSKGNPTPIFFTADYQQHFKCERCGFQDWGETRTYNMSVNTDQVTLKNGQSTTAIRVSDFANGDYLKSVTPKDTGLVTVSNVNKNGTFKLTAKNKNGSTWVTITLNSGVKTNILVTVRVTTQAITNLKSTVSVVKGKKVTLKPVLKPVTSKDKITYSSSNSKIAAVNSKGVITGKKVGTAKITVKAGSKKVIVTVKVTKIKTTKLTGVPKTKTVNRGKTFTIKAVATPRNTDEKVTYRSSNKKIATVTSKGVVKGIRKGTATITVQSGSKKLTCKVTVK